MSPSPEEQQQRYAAIERVYSEQNWPEVERQSQALLEALPDDPGEPLRQRLVLLLAHTRLYGMGDPGGAAGLYQAVAQTNPEPVLLEMAQQGLQQCAALLEAPAAPEAAAESAPETSADAAPEAVPTAAPEASAPETAPDAAPAMPWLQELAEPEIAPTAPPASATPGQDPTRAALSTPFAAPDADGEAAAPEGSDEPEPAPLADHAIEAAAPEPEISGFSPEELAELSRGLLRVVVS